MSTERRSEALYAFAAALCVLTPVLVIVDAPTVARAATALLFLCLAPGCAIAALAGLRSPIADIGVVIGMSLAVATLGAEIMLGCNIWNPIAATEVLAGLCLTALLLAWLRNLVARRKLEHTQAEAASGPAPQPWSFGSGASKLWLGHAIVLIAVIALWVVSLVNTKVGVLSGLGLLAGLPVTYYLALGLLIVGFATAVMAAQGRAAIIWMYVVLLIVILHGTTAVLYPEPRYTWVYKHLGVIDYIATHGSVDRTVDIYQNWPGFFALNAWFSQIAAWKPIDYAAWAQVFFELLNICAVVFALRGLTRDPRHIWVACWIFLWANWIGQDYLSPQAFGFFEGMIVVGLVLRCAQRNWAPRTWLGRWLTRLVAWLQRHSIESPASPGRGPLPAFSPRAALIVGGLCFLASVISHQLTPVIIGAMVTVLTIVRWSRPTWIPLLMAAAVIGWVALAWPFVSTHFQVFSFDIPRAQAPPVLTSSTTLSGVAFVRVSELLIIGFLVALALAEGIVELIERRLPIAILGMAVVPFAIAVVQSYGGEGTLRAYLFALPWLSFLAAGTIVAIARTVSGRLLRWERRTTLVAITAGLALPFLFSYFGQESQNYVSPDDVAVNQWYLANAPAGSVVDFTAPNAPTRLGARYADLNIADAGSTLSDNLALLGHPFIPADVALIENQLDAQRGPAKYVVISPSENNYLVLYGLVPPGWTEGLVSALQASPDFRAVYRSGPAVIFQLVGPPPAG